MLHLLASIWMVRRCDPKRTMRTPRSETRRGILAIAFAANCRRTRSPCGCGYFANLRKVFFLYYCGFRRGHYSGTAQQPRQDVEGATNSIKIEPAWHRNWETTNLVGHTWNCCSSSDLINGIKTRTTSTWLFRDDIRPH